MCVVDAGAKAVLCQSGSQATLRVIPTARIVSSVDGGRGCSSSSGEVGFVVLVI